MTAIRVARATTGRERVVMIEGAYHGSSDVALAGGGERWRRGIPQGLRDSVVTVPLNDVPALRQAVEENAASVAAVVLDLLPNRLGLLQVSREFAQTARELTTGLESVLIVDEVMSFRLGFSGLQAWYGLNPDLTVMGKIIGGGFPVGALAGPAKFMAVLDPLRLETLEHGGTFSGNPVSMRAGLVALELLDRAAIKKLNTLGDLARTLLAPAAAPLGWKVRGIGSLLRLWPNDTRREKEIITRLWWASYKRGLLMTQTGMVSLSTPMTQGVIEHVAQELLRAIEEVSAESVPRARAGYG